MSLSIEYIYNGGYLLRSTSVSEEGFLIRDKGPMEWYRSCTPYVDLLNGIIGLVSTLTICWNLYPYLFRLLDSGFKDIKNGILLNFNRDTNHPRIEIDQNDFYELILFKEDELNSSYAWNLDPMSFFMLRAITMNYKEIKDGKSPTFPADFPFPNGMMNDEIKSRFLSVRNIGMEINLNNSIPKDRLFDFSYSDIENRHTITFNYLGNTSLTIVNSNEVIDRVNTTVVWKHLNGMVSKLTAWNNLVQSHSIHVDNDIPPHFRIICKPTNITKYICHDISIVNDLKLKLIFHIPGSKEGFPIGLGVYSLCIFRRLIDQWDAKVEGRFIDPIYKQILFSGQGFSHLGPERKMFRLEKDREDPAAFRLKYRGEGDLRYDYISACKEMKGIINRFPINEDKNRLSLILNGVDDDGRNHLDKVINAYYEYKIKDKIRRQRLDEDDEEFNDRLFGANDEDSDREDDGTSDSHYRFGDDFENINMYAMRIVSRKNSYLGDVDTSNNSTPVPSGQKPANEIEHMKTIPDADEESIFAI